MARETTSKHIDGITDLVVIAPIKEGFINAYENITYATRLRVVAEALNKIRVSAREHEFVVPFSDVTERILTLLDFRIGVLDKDLFALEKVDSGTPKRGAAPPNDEQSGYTLKQRRYLYLTATFDTALEPYMRLIWDPLGPFLDLIFCNCEGYVTAADHSCEEFLAWVRANQMDSAIFYATTGNTINDDIYHGKIDRLLRMPDQRDRDLAILQTSLRLPEDEAADLRKLADDEADAGKPQRRGKINELALEVLTVLFRLVDFYPPEWLFNPPQVLDHAEPVPIGQDTPLISAPKLQEGKYLARVAYSILHGWDPSKLLPPTVAAYAEPLDWYKTAAQSPLGVTAPKAVDRPTQLDPVCDETEVQAGILSDIRPEGRKVRHGALLLFTVTGRKAARTWIKLFPVQFEHDPMPEDGIYRTVSFTAAGLRQLGLEKSILDQLPKEFRDGMEARSGLIGDLRENHPRRWTLPGRPARTDSGLPNPPVHLSEIDLVIQLRYAPGADVADQGRKPLDQYIADLRINAEAHGLSLAAIEEMDRLAEPDGDGGEHFTDHFGFRDGISQPTIDPAETTTLSPQGADWSNRVRRGEVLAGYRNDRMDYGWKIKPIRKRGKAWRDWAQNAARALSFNGSFLVIRKLSQDRKVFDEALDAAVTSLKPEHPTVTTDLIAAKILGRNRDGSPLLPSPDGQNAFDFKADAKGSACPFASHIRRANPRKVEHGRPSPRIVRRGMSYGKPFDQDPTGKRGLIFMCYQSSIAEQYEVIQRWLNGGNSTGIPSFQGDPLLGVGPKADIGHFGKEVGQPRYYQFELDGKVVRIALPAPSTAIEWGLYLFTPSRAGLNLLTKGLPESEYVMTDPPVDFNDLFETKGLEVTARIKALPPEAAGQEWKRMLEDIDAKDPYELSITPDIWSAIRWYKAGAIRIEHGSEFINAGNQRFSDGGIPNKDNQTFMSAPIVERDAIGAEVTAPSAIAIRKGPQAGSKKQPTVVVASPKTVLHVLRDWRRYSVDEQLHRIEHYSGSIYVTQQPDDKYEWYPKLNNKYNYREEARATNDILMRYDEKDGFADGYEPAQRILAALRMGASALGLNYYKIELRRQFLMPALGAVCSRWFGIPGRLPFDPDEHGQVDPALNAIMENGGWSWKTATDPANPNGPSKRTARCPGDCLAPSRGTFYPRPGASISAYAADHGPAIRKAGEQFIKKYWGTNTPPPGSVASAMFAQMDDQDAVSRNLIGIMVGAMPPIDGNLRGILVEWLLEKTFWRHQSAYLKLRRAGKEPYDAAREALWRPMTRAMCKRPAPDLIYRQANSDEKPDRAKNELPEDCPVKKGDLVIVSLVGAAQQSLRTADRDGDVSIVFGGKRKKVYQGEYGTNAHGEETILPDDPVHACPAQKMAMGAMLGILAALFEAGTIQALPASLIVKIKDWPIPAG